MPTYSKATRQPLYDWSANDLESRTKLKWRLDHEDDDETIRGPRLRPKSQLGAKKFGVEITDGKWRWCYWYRTTKDRDQGLAAYRKRYSGQTWRKANWQILPIDNV